VRFMPSSFGSALGLLVASAGAVATCWCNNATQNNTCCIPTSILCGNESDPWDCGSLPTVGPIATWAVHICGPSAVGNTGHTSSPTTPAGCNRKTYSCGPLPHECTETGNPWIACADTREGGGDWCQGIANP
jgi:hypothetical protein